MVLQLILLKSPGNCLINKLRAIIEIEVDYKFLAKLLIKKILTSRGEVAGLILEEAFGSCKDHRAVEVALCR